MMDTESNFTGPVNIGNPEEHNILELAEAIIRLTSSKSKIVFQKLPKDDPMRRKPDISLARESLKWEPKVSLNDGLTKTIKYYGEWLNVKS